MLFSKPSFVHTSWLIRSLRCSYAPLHIAAKLPVPKVSPNHIHYKKNKDGVQPVDLEHLLSAPTWSIESLLPQKGKAVDNTKVSSEKLHHLLRLSALPPPDTLEEEEKMLGTLSAQLHFVGEMQQMDTTGVKPLRAIRDETITSEKEHTITLKTLKDTLSREKVVGKHYKRIQRNSDPVDASDVELWEVLGSAEKKVGNYFVVESERPQE